MWDLDTLHYLNEEAHIRAVERANELARQEASPATAPIYPLANLAYILVTGPPRLTAIIDLLENSQSIAEFLELVKEYVPEYEAEIMGADDRVREFAYYFGRRYFPLSDEINIPEYSIDDFIRQIPVELMGFSYDDYHGFADFRPGYVLLLSLVESPYADDDDGSRVPILEEVGNLAGKSVLELIPEQGWSVEELHRMLDGSPYEGVAAFADWVNASTGCWQLDCSYVDYEGESWSHDVVDVLTEQWPKVVNIQDKIQKMAEWLEEDERHNFEELLARILNRKDFIIPREQLAFPLDENGQVIRKEVTADGDS
jgi:hypothetical protein